MRSFIKRTIFFVADIIWRILHRKKGVSFSKHLLSAVDIHICLKKPLGYGDLVMLSPFVKMVEDAFPDNKVYLVTEYSPFIEYSRAIWIRPKELIRDNNRFVISPTFSFTHINEMFRADYYLGYFFSPRLISSNNSVDDACALSYSHYLERTYAILDTLKIYRGSEFFYPELISETPTVQLPKSYICVSPYVAWDERQYPYENYCTILRSIIDRYNIDVVIIGGVNELELEKNNKLSTDIQRDEKVHNYTGNISLKSSIEVIRRARLYLGNDSGPSHFAYLVAKQSIVLFGSVLPEHRIPLNKRLSSKIIAIDARESCEFFPCYDGLQKPVCNKDFICLRAISTDRVLNAIGQCM